MAESEVILKNDLAEEGTAAEEGDAGLGVTEDLTDDSSRPLIQGTLAQLRETLNGLQENDPDALVSFYDLLQSVSKPRFDILVVGIAGAGKSSLVNTLLLEYVSKVTDGINPGHTTQTLHYEKKRVIIGDKECELRVWDCPGLDGFDDHDKTVIDDINAKVNDPDLLIICVDIFANSGRRLKNAHDYQIKKLMEVNDGKLFEHCAVVFTKANVISEQYRKDSARDPKGRRHSPESPQWHGQLMMDIARCKWDWQMVFKDAGVKQETIEEIPMCVFGMMEFCRQNRAPLGIQSIGPWRNTWMRTYATQIMNAGKDELTLLYFYICNQFQLNESIDPNLRALVPDGGSLKPRATRNKYLAYLAMGAIGLGGIACTAGAKFSFGLSLAALLKLKAAMYAVSSSLAAGGGVGVTDTWLKERREAEASRKIVADACDRKTSADVRSIVPTVDLGSKVSVRKALAVVAQLEREFGVTC